MNPQTLFNIDSKEGGLQRELAPGINATIFTGEQAMISIVRIDPNVKGTLHHHPEEQWGYCISGSGTRFQDGETFDVKPGDFWLTPGNIKHTVEAGPQGLVVYDVFAPPREAYTKPGSGFASS